MDLIPQLKEEHRTIMKLFVSIHDGIADKKESTEEITDLFRELYEVLTAHLELEDKLLYPVFTRAKQKELKELGKRFSGEMLMIAKKIMMFFTEYEKKSIDELRGSKKSSDELLAIISSVKNRVAIEESVLFPAYEKFAR